MDYAKQRHNMVESQIRPNRVTDKGVIAAMAAIPREAFVPTDRQGIAYVDEALALGNGRYLMEPMVLARLIDAAGPRASDLAMVVGCGTGYGAAVMSHLVGTVVAVESDSGLAQQAAQTLGDLGIDTVAVIEGPLAEGCADQAPFDVIFFDGAIGRIPDAIAQQLADGGRLVAVVADGTVGRGALLTNHGGRRTRREIFDAGTPMLPGFELESSFVF